MPSLSLARARSEHDTIDKYLEDMRALAAENLQLRQRVRHEIDRIEALGKKMVQLECEHEAEEERCVLLLLLCVGSAVR